jgi:hypothetical protein
MYKLKISACMLCLFILGCATMKEFGKMDKFAEISDAYEQAIRWSDFDFALSFLDPSKEKPDLLGDTIFKKIKVTDYRIRKTVVSADESQVSLIVQISYYRTDNVVVNTIIDHQLWKWDPENSFWLLTTGFPQFK